MQYLDSWIGFVLIGAAQARNAPGGSPLALVAEAEPFGRRLLQDAHVGGFFLLKQMQESY